MAGFSNFVSNVINAVRSKADQEEGSSGGIISDIIDKIKDKEEEVKEEGYEYEYIPQVISDASSYSSSQPDEKEQHPVTTTSDNKEKSFFERFQDAKEDFDQRQMGITPELSPSMTTDGSSHASNNDIIDNDIVAPLRAQGLVGENFSDELSRRFLDEEGDLKANPLDWNILGFTSQRITPKETREIYERNFNQEDSQGIRSEPAYNFSNGVVAQNAIDDGSDPSSRESLFMTGDQYIKYREQFGLPGRDVDDIDPNEIYSKQDEQDQYGFIPYLTTQESVDRFHDEAAPHALSNLFNHLANLRRENTDFTINFDNKQINGKDLIRQGKLWSQRNIGQASQVEPTTDPSQIDENSVPYSYVLTDVNGDTIVAKSALVNSYIDEQGRPIMQFEDGDVWTFDDMDDYRNSVGEKPTRDGEFTAYWKNLEPLVLDDGTVLRADKADELLNNNNYQNFSDYGAFNFSNPYIEDPFQDQEGNFNLNPAENSFLPWIVDTALGSVPYFFKPTAAAQGIANAAGNYSGFQPGYQDFLNGTYSLLSDDPNEEQRWTSTLGSLALPVTEHLWGNIGSNIVSKPVMRAMGINEKDIAPLARYGMGAIGEGLEEIPGNFVEDFQRNGLSNWYADEMYRDADGNLTTEDTGVKAYDGQGNVIRNPNTDVTARLRNFTSDIPLALIGGATLGGTLGAPAIGQYRREYYPRKMEREEFGNVLERPGYNGNLRVNLTDEERDFYNR